MSHGDLNFRWDASRDGRRRRVLLDEHGGDSAEPARRTLPISTAAAKSPSNTQPARRYAPDALHERQARITDLVPKRPWTLLVLLLLALTGVAGVAALYSQWGSAIGRSGGDALAALDMAAPGSLATWFSSMLLLAGAVGSVLVYTIRRHKADDYRGRYRVWLWAAAALAIASIDATARLHLMAHHVIVELVGASILSGKVIWPLVGMTLVYGPFGVRMLLEIRSSRGATVSLACAAASYATAAAVALIWPERTAGSLAALTQSSAVMLGHVCMWYTVVVYARHVYLDAQGALPVARRERKSSGKSVEKMGSDIIDRAASRSADNSNSRSSASAVSPALREKESTSQTSGSAGDDEKDKKPAKRSWLARLLGRRGSTGEPSQKKARKARPTKAERQAMREAQRAAKLAAKRKAAAKPAAAADASRAPAARAADPKLTVESSAASRRVTPSTTPPRAVSKPQDSSDDAPRGGFARLWRRQEDADAPAAPQKAAVAKSVVQDADDDEGDESAIGPDGRKLSKSERRRLRKLQRRAARRAA